jgi:hypothetical protein
VGGVKLPLALAELGLIDEYEFLVQPRLVGHGPTLFAGLSKRIDSKRIDLMARHAAGQRPGGTSTGLGNWRAPRRCVMVVASLATSLSA